MEYRRLGRSGLKVSRLCLGCMGYGKGGTNSGWALDEDQSLPFFRRALEHGINFFDTADIYGEGEGERVLGRAIHKLARREEVVISTKFGLGTAGPGQNEKGASRKHILSAIDGALRRLGTDYIDLWQLHR